MKTFVLLTLQLIKSVEKPNRNKNRLIKLPGWHITWKSEVKGTSAASLNKMPLVCILPSTTTVWCLSVDESAVVGTVGSSPIRATWKHPQGSLTPWAALPLCCGLCCGPWMTPAPLGCGLAAPGNSLRCSPTDKRGFVEAQVSSTEVPATFVRAKITSLDTTERVVFAWLPSHIRLFCDLMDCSPPGSSVDGISKARILEWVVTSFSRGSSWLRYWTRISCIAGVLNQWAERLKVGKEGDSQRTLKGCGFYKCVLDSIKTSPHELLTCLAHGFPPPGPWAAPCCLSLTHTPTHLVASSLCMLLMVAVVSYGKWLVSMHRHTDGQQVHENITDRQRNANLSYNELSTTSHLLK